MQAAFRVDSSDAIGTGHLMRCLTLAEGLRARGAGCLFVMRDLPGAQLRAVGERGFATAILPAPKREAPRGGLAHSEWLGVDQEEDIVDTLAALPDPQDWLVVDHYALDSRWHTALRARARQVLVIDDIADRSLDCDVLVDQNLQLADDRYSGLTPSSTRKLLGPRYALLRKSFSDLRKQAGQLERIDLRRILVFLGGVDAAGGTLSALQAIELAEIDHVSIDVVIGPRNARRTEIEAWCKARKNARLVASGPEIAELMMRADLSIGAAGVTAWERCCLGLPTLLLTIAHNQRDGARALARHGAVIWGGDVAETPPSDLAAILRLMAHKPEHLVHLSNAAAVICDGDGVRRVVTEMFRRPISIRGATERDCDLIWEWRNEQGTRKFVNDSRPIDLDRHREWFAAVLTDPDRDLLIGEDSDGPVGVLRFDRSGIEATISVFLVPIRRGQGLGSHLIVAGLDWLGNRPLPVEKVVAHVLAGNRHSSNAFEAAGFAQTAQDYSIDLRNWRFEKR